MVKDIWTHFSTDDTTSNKIADF